MMRNWFILFTTVFTITTLILTITTWFIPDIARFSSHYIILLAVSSSLISFVIIFSSKLPIENIFFSMLIDISSIFLIVFLTGITIKLIPIDLMNFILVLSLVVIIYIIISLIYLSVLTKEAENMNKKILEWRKKHVMSESYK